MIQARAPQHQRPMPPLPAFLSGQERRVLNVGSGHARPGRLHPAFRPERWEEVRLDIDANVRPDLVGSVLHLGELILEASFDAVWCSHVLEHLQGHDVVPALRHCRKVLKPDGFALVTSPDLSAIAARILAADIEAPAYQSPAGPISALDMLFGHGASVQAGNAFMAHRTGFTADRLGRLAAAAGFAESRVAPGSSYDLWAVLMMPKATPEGLKATLAGTPLADLLF